MTKKAFLASFLIIMAITSVASIDMVQADYISPTALSSADSSSVLPSLAWNRTYTENNLWSVASAFQTADGGFMLGGITPSNGSAVSLELMKIDSLGNPQWSKIYPSTAGGVSNYEKWFVRTTDGSYAIAGQFERNAWMAKLDAEGNMLWNQTYNGTENSVANTLNQTSDGGYILTGNSYTNNGSSSSTWMMKTDAFGNEQWNTTINGADAIIQTTDEGYAFTAESSRMNLYEGEIYIDCALTKTDSNGTEQWSQVYSDFGFGWSIFQTTDGGFVLGGGKGIGLTKLNAAGTMQWNQSYSPGQAWTMTETSDGGFALAGTALVKTDAAGNEKWALNFSDGGHAYTVIQTSDGGYLCAGQLPLDGGRTSWVAKINIAPITNATPSPFQSSSPNPSPTPSPSPSKQPIISILSPTNGSSFNILFGGVIPIFQLTYATNSTLSWVGYSIDGANNVTATRNNTAVIELVTSDQYHTLIVYANDTEGNWATPQTVSYLVNVAHDYTPTPSPSPTQQPTPNNAQGNLTSILILAVLVVAFVVVGLLVYFRRRRGWLWAREHSQQ